MATAVVLASSPTFAQPRKLEVQANRHWKHDPTGVKFPPVLVGLARDAVIAYTGNGTDVSANYRTADGSDQITVYLYRNVSGNVPVWFDRASSIIQLLPEKYPNIRSLGVRPFTPRGQRVASGLIETFNVGAPARSTGLILFPVNGFYVKVRATSLTRDAAGLEALLLSAANSFDWSSRVAGTPAMAVRDCAAPLPRREPAAQVEAKSEDRMMSGLIGGILAQSTELQLNETAAEYCREPGRPQISYGVYRPSGATDRYIMALLDSGRAIAVGSSELAKILVEQRRAPQVSVTHIELDRTLTYGNFATLPLPEQALAMVESSPPASVASTWGRKRSLTIATEK